MTRDRSEPPDGSGVALRPSPTATAPKRDRECGVSEKPDGQKTDFMGSKPRPMSAGEMNEFLQKPWIAKIACLTPDGSPYIAASWYHWDGVAFWVVPRARSEWAHYLARDPRVHCRGRRGGGRTLPRQRGDVDLEQDRHIPHGSPLPGGTRE